jgi:uncharacterized membrane protein YhaH (DUF805 family)
VSDDDPNSKSRLSSASAAPQWHLHIPPDTYGPYSVQQLRDFARDGRMTADTLVWTGGADAWGRAGDQPALKAIFPAAAPPAPPATQAGPPPRTTVARAAAAPSAAPAGARAMSFGESARTCLRLKYAGFQGRARRSEYWWFMLFVMLVWAVVYGLAAAIAVWTSPDVVGGVKDGGAMSIVGVLALAVAVVAVLALALPSIAVAVRRLHDLGWSGWWYLTLLIPIVGGVAALVMLIAFMMRGNDGPNKYGPDPLAVGEP